MSHKKVLNLVKSLIDKDVNLTVAVSVEGIGNHHDKIRGVDGNFKKVDWLIKRFVDLKKEYPNFNFSIGYTLSEYTSKYFEEVRKYGEKYGKEIAVQIYDTFPHYKNKELSRNNNDVIEKFKTLPKSFYRETIIKAMQNKLKFKCFALQSFCMIRYDGNMSPCGKLTNLIVGNVKYNTPTEIWTSEKAKEMRKKILNCSCINTSIMLSYDSYYYPILWYMLKNFPYVLIKMIKKGEISL